MEFKLALHTGDDNDNMISRFTTDADSKESLFNRLEQDFKGMFLGNIDDITIDGDDDSLLIMWYENDIPYHHDYYLES